MAPKFYTEIRKQQNIHIYKNRVRKISKEPNTKADIFYKETNKDHSSVNVNLSETAEPNIVIDIQRITEQHKYLTYMNSVYYRVNEKANNRFAEDGDCFPLPYHHWHKGRNMLQVSKNFSIFIIYLNIFLYTHIANQEQKYSYLL